MTSRATVIVALVALQASIVVLGVASVFGGLRAEPFGFTRPVASVAAGSELAKNGTHHATVTGLRADASIRSVGSGSVAIRDFDGTRLRAWSRGSILMQRIVAERVDVASTSDRVEGSALRIRDGTIDADDRVTLGFVAGADTLVDAETSDGKVDVAGIPGATAGARNDDDSASATVRIGAGAGRLEVHANDGNVTLGLSVVP